MAKSNVTAPAPVVTIFATVSVVEPPTESAEAFSKRIVSADAGVPLGDQLVATAQSAPLAPAQVYVSADSARGAAMHNAAAANAAFLIAAAVAAHSLFALIVFAFPLRIELFKD